MPIDAEIYDLSPYSIYRMPARGVSTFREGHWKDCSGESHWCSLRRREIDIRASSTQVGNQITLHSNPQSVEPRKLLGSPSLNISVILKNLRRGLISETPKWSLEGSKVYGGIMAGISTFNILKELRDNTIILNYKWDTVFKISIPMSLEIKNDIFKTQQKDLKIKLKQILILRVKEKCKIENSIEKVKFEKQSRRSIIWITNRRFKKRTKQLCEKFKETI